MVEKIIVTRGGSEASPFSSSTVGTLRRSQPSARNRDTTCLRVEAATVVPSTPFRKCLHVRCGTPTRGWDTLRHERETRTGNIPCLEEILRIPGKIRSTPSCALHFFFFHVFYPYLPLFRCVKLLRALYPMLRRFCFPFFLFLLSFFRKLVWFKSTGISGESWNE